MKKIELKNYLGNRRTLFTGREQGEEVREKLKLDDVDNLDETLVLIIPKGTTSINPSFYLGLFYTSLKVLGLPEFENKYVFQFEDENLDVVDFLKENIEDAKRNALNSIKGKTGFYRFFFNSNKV